MGGTTALERRFHKKRLRERFSNDPLYWRKRYEAPIAFPLATAVWIATLVVLAWILHEQWVMRQGKGTQWPYTTPVRLKPFTRGLAEDRIPRLFEREWYLRQNESYYLGPAALTTSNDDIRVSWIPNADYALRWRIGKTRDIDGRIMTGHYELVSSHPVHGRLGLRPSAAPTARGGYEHFVKHPHRASRSSEVTDWKIIAVETKELFHAGNTGSWPGNTPRTSSADAHTGINSKGPKLAIQLHTIPNIYNADIWFLEPSHCTNPRAEYFCGE